LTTLTKTLLTSSAVLVLTVVHHIYGAAVYATPWRHHIAVVVLPVLLLLILAYYIHRWRPRTLLGKVSLRAFMVLTLLVPVGLIGLFEGGYNHLAKNALFFGGFPRDKLQRLFPAPTYEMPNDLWFEGSGVLQFFIALWAAYYLVRLWTDTRDAAGNGDGRVSRFSTRPGS
jgi:hypothetical protein